MRNPKALRIFCLGSNLLTALWRRPCEVSSPLCRCYSRRDRGWCGPHCKSGPLGAASCLAASISVVQMPDDLSLIFSTCTHFGFLWNVVDAHTAARAPALVSACLLDPCSFVLRCMWVCVYNKNYVSSFLQKNLYATLVSAKGLLSLGTACKYVRFQCQSVYTMPSTFLSVKHLSA